MRIVAGKWGGRTLRAPHGMAVRPTTDRVREALFSILGDRVEGRAVLDLFAGTGALSIEAMSRGASSAFLAEPDPDAFAALSANLASVGATGADTFKGDFRKAIRRLALQQRRFGLVFLDPPYGKGLAAAAAKAISAARLLSGDALVVVEEASRTADASFPAGWDIITDRRYGDTRVTIFEVAAPSSDGPEPGLEHQRP
jgi:16S rRNA (guanine966-N2)-methyltransferase